MVIGQFTDLFFQFIIGMMIQWSLVDSPIGMRLFQPPAFSWSARRSLSETASQSLMPTVMGRSRHCFVSASASDSVYQWISMSILVFLFKGLRLTAGRRPSNDLWCMVWEDWAEILRANPGRAMLNWGRHNAQCLPVWKESGPIILSPCWAKSGPCWAGPSWAYIGPGWAYVGPMLGPSWTHVGPMLGLCWPMLSPFGSDVGAMFGPSMLKRF